MSPGQFGVFLLLMPLHAAAPACASVERLDHYQGALTVHLRNACAHPIAALSLLTTAPSLPAPLPTRIDFTVGLGLPATLASRLSPGASPGLFAPGSTRDVNATSANTNEPPQVQVQGVIFADGAELGETASLRPFKQAWHWRLAELESLDLHIRKLQTVHPRSQADLDSLPYIANRLKQLAHSTNLQADHRAAAEVELKTFEQLVSSLNAGIASKAIGRAAAQTQLHELRLSRLTAHRAFVANLK